MSFSDALYSISEKTSGDVNISASKKNKIRRLYFDSSETDMSDDNFIISKSKKPELIDDYDSVDDVQDIQYPIGTSKRDDMAFLFENAIPLEDDDDFFVNMAEKPCLEDAEDDHNISSIFENASSSDEDDDFIVKMMEKPNIGENDDYENIDVSKHMNMLMGNNLAKQTLPFKQSIDSEYEVAQYIMQKMHFAYSDGSLYTYTDPAYEVLDTNVLIAKIKQIVPIEIMKKPKRFFTNVISHIETTASNQINLTSIQHPIEKIYFKNGCYDVKTKTFSRASPLDYITSYNNIEYNPENAHNGKTTEYFFEYSSDGDKEIQQLMWTSLGCTLSTTSKFKKFFYFFGDSDSGKSVFGNLCINLVGRENCSYIQLHDFCGKYSAAQLYGKKLNISLDTPADKLTKLGVLKMLTSGGTDVIEAEKKYGKHKIIRSDQIKLAFASNNPIRIDTKEDVLSFRNRLLIIPFPKVVPNEEKNIYLLDHLMEEKDYIIKKALKSYRKLLENNFVFPHCEESEKLLNEWFPPMEQEVFRYFFNSEYITYDITSQVSCNLLFHVYETFCQENNFKAMSRNTFISKVRNLPGLSSIRMEENNQRIHGIKGIKLN